MRLPMPGRSSPIGRASAQRGVSMQVQLRRRLIDAPSIRAYAKPAWGYSAKSICR